MCFTFVGRTQTRLIALIGPLLLACVYLAASGDPIYLTLFSLMVALAVGLDVGVYNWLIGYQPRWLTFVLGAAEFGLLAMMGLPRVDLGRMAAFYVPAWLLSWLTIEIVLPLAWPRWIEDGGELRPSGARLSERPRIPEAIADRRRIFTAAGVTLLVGGLPWIAAAAATPRGYHFTGVLDWPALHLPAIAQLVAAIRGDAAIAGSTIAARDLAQAAAWFGAALIWLLVIGRRAGPERSLPWPPAAFLLPLFFPAPLVAGFAGAAWLLPSLPWPWMMRTAVPTLAAVLLAVGIGLKLWAGTLSPYHALLLAIVFAWMLGIGSRFPDLRRALGLAAIILSPLVLPPWFVAILFIAAWPFLLPSSHWLTRSVLSLPALAVFFVWSAAHAGAIDAVSLYQTLWLASCFAWFLGVAVVARDDARLPVWLAASALVPLTLPLPLVALLAVAVWIRPALPRFDPAPKIVSALAAVALVVWGLSWMRAGAAGQGALSPAYLDDPRWLTARWLRLNTEAYPIAQTSTQADDLTVALGGGARHQEHSGTLLWLTFGQNCGIQRPLFQQGDVCMVPLDIQP